jgi:hypothetical protein
MLAERLGMRTHGGGPHAQRAAEWFVKWWREKGGLISASSALAPTTGGQRPPRMGWGFDFEWAVDETGENNSDAVQKKMEECIDAYLKDAEEVERFRGGISATQEKKLEKEAAALKRATKVQTQAKRAGWRR